MTKEERRSYYRRWARKNRKRIRAYYREWAAKNRARIRQTYRRFYKKHRARILRRQRANYRKDPSSFNARNRESVLRLKRETLKHYGAACRCCGESHIELLTIDHLTGRGGRLHRRGKTPLVGARMYRWLRKKGFPKGFQILCWNCNAAKGLFGSCPHSRN
jgi:hypothetical protein